MLSNGRVPRASQEPLGARASCPQRNVLPPLGLDALRPRWPRSRRAGTCPATAVILPAAECSAPRRIGCALRPGRLRSGHMRLLEVQGPDSRPHFGGWTFPGTAHGLKGSFPHGFGLLDSLLWGPTYLIRGERAPARAERDPVLWDSWAVSTCETQQATLQWGPAGSDRGRLRRKRSPRLRSTSTNRLSRFAIRQRSQRKR